MIFNMTVGELYLSIKLVNQFGLPKIHTFVIHASF